MDTDTTTATTRWAKLAFASAGIIAATVIGVAVKVGVDMANYFETSTVLTGDGVVAQASPMASSRAPTARPGPAVVAAAAPTVEARNDDAADPRATALSVTTAP